MEQVIYLKPDDDMAAISGSLEHSQAPRLILVIPPNSRALTNPVHLKLLKRRARALALEVALVTRDEEVRKLASEQGFAVFPSLKRAQKSHWSGPPPEERPLPPFRGLPPRPTTPPPRTYPTPSREQRALAWGLIGIGLFFVLVLALLLVPNATVTLIPVTEEVEASVSVQVSTEVARVNPEKGLVPARLVREEMEGKAQIPTTGRRDRPDQHARGTVIFTNLTAEPVLIPAGTIVRTSTGVNVRFTTLTTVTLPGTIQATVEAEVEAVDPGPSGNVQAYLINRIEGPLQARVRVINDKPTHGGTVRQVGVVTLADKERIRSSLLRQLQQEAYARLTSQAGEEEFILAESLSTLVIDEVYDKFVDEEADFLGLSMRVVVNGLAVRKEDLKAIALKALEGRIREGYRLIPQGLRFEVGSVEKEGDKVSMELRARGFMIPHIDENQIKAMIRGQPIPLAEKVLYRHLSLAMGPSVKVTPSWWKRMPWLPMRIRLLIKLSS